MLIERVKNPKNPKLNENIVRLTMTLDQFYNLCDCVSMAYAKAATDSRMALVADMVHKDFENLRKDLGARGAE